MEVNNGHNYIVEMEPVNTVHFMVSKRLLLFFVDLVREKESVDMILFVVSTK